MCLIFSYGILGNTNVFAQKQVHSLLIDAKKKKAKLDYAQSIKLYKEALQLAPDNCKALEGLIDIYLYKYELFDSAEIYLEKRINNIINTPNPIIYFDYANCLRLQEKQSEALDQYAKFKTCIDTKAKYILLEEELNGHIAACQFAIKNKLISDKEANYTVENMDYFINSVDSEYTPVFIEEDSLLLYNARYKDFETEEITTDLKYYENIYYFDLTESVASSYNPSISQETHHAVVGKGDINQEILVFHNNKLWKGFVDQNRLNQITELPNTLCDQYFFQPHGIYADNGNIFIFSAMDRPVFEGGNLDIYISYKKDTSWTDPRSISPLINSDMDEDSPFLSPNGRELYFSSKGHNSSGGYDIYKSTLVNGEWSTPKNLGYPMNSAGDDIYLSFSSDGKSGFFSSNRAGGFGGMDIYKFTRNQKSIEGIAYDKSGNRLAGVNVTLHNTTDNKKTQTTTNENGAYSFNVDSDKTFELLGEKSTYFSGTGKANTMVSTKTIKTDLYLEKDPGISIYAIVTDKISGKALDGVSIRVNDNISGEMVTYLTTKTGACRKPIADKKLNDRGSYNFTLEKEGYLSKTITYNTIFDRAGVYNLHTDIDISLEKIEVGEDLSNVIAINPIYFDVNKSDIRADAALELDKVVKVMNENPNMVIELGSHTDARGSASSNETLSERRAMASAEYIRQRISNPERIIGKGYGESDPVNECKDGVKCSKEKHQENRRTEFIIVEF